MKKLMISMLLASPVTIWAMNNNNNSQIQAADENTRLLRHHQAEYNEGMEECALNCCCIGFMNQKYEHMKEEREVDFQLRMAEKKRQLAAALVGVNNTAPTSNIMGQLPATLPHKHEAPCEHCAAGVDNFCKGVSTCAVWTVCFPCLCERYGEKDPSVDDRIAAMEKKKQFIEKAASLGFYEDPKRRKNDDNPWAIHHDRYVRIPDNTSTQQ